MDGNIALLVALAAAVTGPLVAYIGANRKLSGKIGTSEASSLWEESRSIREDLHAQLQKATDRILDLERRVSNAEAQNNTLIRENYALTAKNNAYEATIAELNIRLDLLEKENARLTAEVDRLKIASLEGQKDERS